MNKSLYIFLYIFIFGLTRYKTKRNRTLFKCKKVRFLEIIQNLLTNSIINFLPLKTKTLNEP